MTIGVPDRASPAKRTLPVRNLALYTNQLTQDWVITEPVDTESSRGLTA